MLALYSHGRSEHYNLFSAKSFRAQPPSTFLLCSLLVDRVGNGHTYLGMLLQRKQEGSRCWVNKPDHSSTALAGPTEDGVEPVNKRMEQNHGPEYKTGGETPIL